MSHDVRLVDSDIVLVSRQKISEGGTHVSCGTNECELNVTYNYSPLFYEVFPNDEGLKWLYGKTGKESIPVLEQAVERLGTKRDSDYWKATMGNAGYSLGILLDWAREFPQGKWEIF